jgi:hypothetical protein
MTRRKPIVVAALAVLLACWLGASGGSAAAKSAAADKGPDLSGTWITSPGTGFRITSGRSTKVGGYLVDDNQNFAGLSGTISDGSGVLYSSYNETITETIVVTSVSGNTMTGFYADDVNSEGPPPPPTSIGECEADKQAATDPSVSWNCGAWTATRGAAVCRVDSVIEDRGSAASDTATFAGHTDTDGVILRYSASCNTMKVKWTGELTCDGKTSQHTPIKNQVFSPKDRGVTLTDDDGEVHFHLTIDNGPGTTGNFSVTLSLARSTGTVNAHYSDPTCYGGIKNLAVKRYSK